MTLHQHGTLTIALARDWRIRTVHDRKGEAAALAACSWTVHALQQYLLHTLHVSPLAFIGLGGRSELQPWP